MTNPKYYYKKTILICIITFLSFNLYSQEYKFKKLQKVNIKLNDNDVNHCSKIEYLNNFEKNNKKNVYFNNTHRNYDNKIKYIDNKDSSSTSQLLMGIGFTYNLWGSNTTRLLLSFSGYLNIYKAFYLGGGINIYKEPYWAITTISSIFVIPTFRFILKKNKLDLYTSFGLCGSQEEFLSLIFGLRLDYNLNKILSCGLDIKHPVFFGSVYVSYPLILTNVYLSIKF